MNPVLQRLRSFSTFRTVLTLLFLCFLASRTIHPLADPPRNLDWSLGLFFDEGIYNQNVRNLALFDQWTLDEWNDYYYSAVSTWVKYLILSVIGVGRLQIRLISIIYSLISVFLVYRAVRESYGKPTALLATLLFGINYISVMYSRLGMQDTQTLAVFILAFYLWQKSVTCKERKRTVMYAVLAGSISFLSYTYKNLFLYLLPAPFLALMLGALVQARQSPRRKRFLMGLGYLTAGICFAGLIWYVTFYRPYHVLIAQFGKFFTTHQMFPDTRPWQLWLNFYHTPFFKYFSATPILTGGALLFVWWVSVRVWSAQRVHIPLTDLFLAFWFLAAFGFTGIIAYRPTRYFLPVIPPMCIMTARILARFIFRHRSADRSQAVWTPFAFTIHWSWYPVSVFWLTLIIQRYILRWGPLDFYNTSPALVLSAAVALAITALFGYATIHWRNRAMAFPPFWLRVCGVGVLAWAVYAEGRAYYQWVRDPHYEIVSMEQDIRQLLGANAAIGGMDAPGVAYDTPYRTVISYDQYVNYAENPIKQYQLTHLFLGQNSAFPETEYYFHRYPDEMRNATLLRQYTLHYGGGGVDFNLFSLVEPKVKQRGALTSDFRAGSPFQMTIKTQNRDFRQSRKLYLNWFWYARENSAEVPVSSGSELSAWLLPDQTREFTLTGRLPDQPGQYDLLISWDPIQEVRYEAETMEHQLGTAHRDRAAFSNQARVHDPAQSSGEGFLAYGRYYQDCQPGMYETVFRIKADSAPLADAPVARIEVVARYGQDIITQRTLSGSDFTNPGLYQDFVLPYRLTAFTPDVEYRVYVFGAARVWADEISTLFRQGLWHEDGVWVQAPVD